MIYLNEVMFKKSRGSPSEGIVWLPQKEEMNAGELRVPPQRPLRLRATSASESIRETRPPPTPSRSFPDFALKSGREIGGLSLSEAR